jgi:hypothetical protein
MSLKNDFGTQTRLLYCDLWECWICGCNGTNRGGLELHHIKGRESRSPLNAAPLCHYCHEHMNHNDKEEIFLLGKTIRILLKLNYKFEEDDLAFYNKNKKLYDKVV